MWKAETKASYNCYENWQQRQKIGPLLRLEVDSCDQGHLKMSTLVNWRRWICNCATNKLQAAASNERTIGPDYIGQPRWLPIDQARIVRHVVLSKQLDRHSSLLQIISFFLVKYSQRSGYAGKNFGPSFWHFWLWSTVTFSYSELSLRLQSSVTLITLNCHYSYSRVYMFSVINIT